MFTGSNLSMKLEEHRSRAFQVYCFPLFRGIFSPLSADFTKWSNTQAMRRQQPTNSLSVFDHFVELVLKGLGSCQIPNGKFCENS